MSGCGNILVGYFLFSVGKYWNKTFDTRNLWKSALVLTLGFVREMKYGSFEVILSINLTREIFVDTPLFLLSWGSGSVNFTTMFTNPFCITYLTGQRFAKLSYGVTGFLFTDVRHILDKKLKN